MTWCPSFLGVRELWLTINAMILGSWKQGFNSLITLGEWIVWKHCNNIVLNGAKPSVELILRQILEAVTSGKLEAGFELADHSG